MSRVELRKVQRNGHRNCFTKKFGSRKHRSISFENAGCKRWYRFHNCSDHDTNTKRIERA